MDSAIISAIGGTVSAIAAVVAIIFQIVTQCRLKKEKHMLTKARFIAVGYSFNGRVATFNILNQNNYAISDLSVKWCGCDDVKCNINQNISASESFDFQVTLEFNDGECRIYDDYFEISYNNIYNEKCSSRKKFKTGVLTSGVETVFGGKYFIN